MTNEGRAEKLKQALEYDSTTGIITWRCHCKPRLIGKEAGVIDPKGYRMIGFDYKNLRAGRIAWLLFYGSWPVGVIDHINGIRDDNRVCNLRDVSVEENDRNRKEHRNGHIVGTTFFKRTGRWKAQVNKNGKRVGLGYFDTQEEAGKAYQSAINKG